MTALPHDESIERAVIGCALSDPDGPERTLWHASQAGIDYDAFHTPVNQLIWRVICEMVASGKQCDLVTVTAKLRTDGYMPQLEAATCLSDIVEATGSPSMAGAYVASLRAFQQRRRLITKARRIIDAAYGMEGDDVDGAVAEAQTELLSLNVAGKRRTHAEVAEAIRETWTAAHEGSPAGLPCPWKRLQQTWGGPHKRLVTLVAARKGTGKSTLIGQWVYHLASELNIPVAVCPFEDGPNQFFGRMAALRGRFSSFKASQGRFRDRMQLEDALSHIEPVTKLPIQFLDGRVNLADLSAWAIQQKAKHGIKALFVDAFKDVLTPGKENRDDIELSAGLTALADRLDIPVIVTAHIRKTDSPIIGMDDIRGSSRLADDCKLILAIQRVGEEFAFDVLANNFGPTTPKGGIAVQRMTEPERFEESPM